MRNHFLESAEIFDGWELKNALEHEVGTVATMLGYSAETLVVSQHQADAMPRATWNLPGWTALQALVALVQRREGNVANRRRAEKVCEERDSGAQARRALPARPVSARSAQRPGRDDDDVEHYARLAQRSRQDAD